jgi:hypothetical protein
MNRLLLILWAPFLPACGGPSTDVSVGGTSVDGPLTIVVSGDTDGWIVPCGCTSNQSGGLPRRGSCVAEIREEAPVLLVDAGGAACGQSRHDRLRFEAILRGEAEMGIAAHNVGASELALGVEVLRRLGRETGVRWISANVRDRQGRLLFDETHMVTTAGRRVALVGLLAPSHATADVQLSPPDEAMLDLLPRIAGRYDHLVVLAYLPEDELRGLAELLPEVDLVVGGPTGQPIPPTRVGPVTLASATHQGKFLAVFQYPAGGPSEWSGRIVELSERFADDPTQLGVVRQYHDRLEQLDIPATDTSYVPQLPRAMPDGFAVAGTESCRECHEEECHIWDESGHAQAWQSLSEKRAHVDPSCQRCHTIGYGMPGGFVSARRSTDRVHVGCESCHGPSAAHAADSRTRTAHYRRARDHCRQCHDRENSPRFQYDEYWERIRHGAAGPPPVSSHHLDSRDAVAKGEAS